MSEVHGGLPCYRQLVLKYMPWLQKLDDVPVNYNDVAQAQQLDLSQVNQMMINCQINEEMKPHKKYSVDSFDLQSPTKFVSQTSICSNYFFLFDRHGNIPKKMTIN